MTFKELEKVFSEHYYMGHEPDFLKVLMATVLSKRLDGEMVWLLVLAPPSSGKAMVSTLSKCSEVKMVSTLTANSLMSGARKEDTYDGKNASLLPQLHGRVMVVKDASTIQDMNPNAKAQVFSMLRSAYDGDPEEKHTGLGTVKVASKFGIIIAGTPGFEQSRVQERNLGERFIIFRPAVEADNRHIWSMIRNSIGKQKKYQILCDAVLKFLDACNIPNRIMHPVFIEDLAEKLATLRGGFTRDKYTREITWGPTIENPYRVGQQFSSLFTTLSYIDNQHNATAIVRRMIVDSVPFQRLEALKFIHRMNGNDPTRTCFHNYIGWGRKKVSEVIEELEILKVVGSRESGSGKILYISPDYRGLFYFTPRY
jgi:hypothetical protein